MPRQLETKQKRLAWRALREAGLLAVVLWSGWACGGLSQSGDGGSGGGAPGSGGAAGGSDAGGTTSAGGQPDSSGGAAAASGGASGGMDSGGTSAGGASSEPECEVDEDCEIAADCCTCRAVPKGDLTATCRLDCGGSNACETQGVFAVPHCSLGRCTLATCDSRSVSCDAATPECPSGQAPSVTESGCWGPCIAIAECTSVSSCEVCGDDLCVTLESFGPFIQCVAPRAGCEVGNLCECLSPCPNACTEQEDGAHCYCPSC